MTAIPIEAKQLSIQLFWLPVTLIREFDQSIVAFLRKNHPYQFFGAINVHILEITWAHVVHRNDLLIKGLLRTDTDASVLLFWLALLRDGKHRIHDQNHPIEWCRFDHSGAMMLTAEQIWWLIWWSALAAFVLVLLLLQQRWSHSIVSLHRLQTPLPQHLTGTWVEDAIPRWLSPAER